MTKPHQLEKQWLTLDELSFQFAIKRTRAYTLIADGKLLAKKLNKRLLVSADSVRQFMDGLPAAELAAPGPRRAA